MTKSEKEQANRELKKIIDEFQDTYNSMRTASELKYKRALPEGSAFYKKDGFYSDEDRREFETVCYNLRQKAHAIADKAAADILELTMAAPSAEAVNVVNLINSRQNVSEEEIEQLMNKYGAECPMVYKSLYEKAVSLGYRDFMPHEIERAAENVNVLNRLIDETFTTEEAERNLTVAAAAFNGTIDDAFPAEK